ncbi:MAG: IPT/TIG domain-containing protein [Actinobacteria bacterium]|nr:IPT/TIG domain-containing protein [Actinomycetota bacterium]
MSIGGEMRRAIVILSCVLLAASVVAATPSGASARMVLVGSPLGYTFNIGILRKGGAVVVAETALSEPGANVASPVSGLVVQWTTKGRYQGGPFRLVILRPTPLGLVGAGRSGPQTPVGESAQSYPTALPIQAGDMIGIETSKELDSVGIQQSATGATIETLFPPPLEGSPAATTTTDANTELGLNATVQATPEVLQITPAAGPTAGGTAVTITGDGFESVTSVDFGGTPAAGFTVKSAKSIVATSPGAQAGPVSVGVTTIAGTSTASDGSNFTYTGPPPTAAPPPAPTTPPPTPVVQCHVPSLLGKTVKASRKRLEKVGCKLGKVRGSTGPGARVRKQRPAPGKVLPVGSKVAVKLGTK